MLQDNTWTGLLFLAGIFISSFTMGMATVLAVLSGTLTAMLLKYNKEEIQNGLYGFSASLTGICLVFFFKPESIIWLAIMVGSALATIIQHAFIVRKIPGYTFPFIVVTWLLVFILKNILFISPSAQSLISEINNGMFFMPFKGYSQVMFINNYVTGIIFFIAIFISLPVGALYSLLSALLAGIMAYFFSLPAVDIDSGLFSFNAVLCAIALLGKRKADAGYILFSIVLALLIQMGMIKMNWIVLTFPFVLSTWIVLLIKKRIFKSGF